MKNYKYILLILFFILLSENLFSQIDKKNLTILFTIEDSDLNLNVDTIYFERNEITKIYFIDNTVFCNRKKIYSFKNVEYYMQLAQIKYDDKSYIYIYPKYQNRTGPYIWYNLGVLIEIDDNAIIVRSNYDYFDIPDIYQLLDSKEHKIERKINLQKIRKTY